MRRSVVLAFALLAIAGTPAAHAADWGAPFTVTADHSIAGLSAAADPRGGMVVVWQHDTGRAQPPSDGGYGGVESYIRARAFAPSGSAGVTQTRGRRARPHRRHGAAAGDLLPLRRPRRPRGRRDARRGNAGRMAAGRARRRRRPDRGGACLPAPGGSFGVQRVLSAPGRERERSGARDRAQRRGASPRGRRPDRSARPRRGGSPRRCVPARRATSRRAGASCGTRWRLSAVRPAWRRRHDPDPLARRRRTAPWRASRRLM